MISILIVDPDPAIRTLAGDVLAGAGVHCSFGDDPQQAAQLASLRRPQAVLLPIGPDLEGIAAARTIKAEWPRTVVVLLTGHGEDAYLGLTGKTGADALLAKGALRRDLLPTLRRLNGPAFRKLWDGTERRGRPLGGWRWDGSERRQTSSRGRRTPLGRIRMSSDYLERSTPPVRHPHSGLERIPFLQPCHLNGVKGQREANICNLSAAGVYVALEPVPDVGEGFALSFQLPEGEVPLTVDCVVTWRNALWDRRISDLPPGCGLQFLGLPSQGLQIIHAMVKDYVTMLPPPIPWAPGP